MRKEKGLAGLVGRENIKKEKIGRRCLEGKAEKNNFRSQAYSNPLRKVRFKEGR